MGGGDHHGYNPVWHYAHSPAINKKNTGNDTNLAMLKLSEYSQFWASYGSGPRTRGKNGAFWYKRATGSEPVFGKRCYTVMNFLRLSRYKYAVAAIPFFIYTNTFMNFYGNAMEIDVDLENAFPYHAKKDPLHGH
eukprot:NODE_10164_length_536_cov_30.135593_g9518_i0.p1 GENE.NODE_10164_length_536_cov_30.135593_g9518_i0~~NODE_10164_length_536_cov_30.135593_g9518_i0.p1  ORF type:complete len:151 (+),score=24.91 NODE_10164_length_536_cov_30.135593_g9518_i0:50-454(+)